MLVVACGCMWLLGGDWVPLVACGCLRLLGVYCLIMIGII